jgi:hypothetical protein
VCQLSRFPFFQSQSSQVPLAAVHSFATQSLTLVETGLVWLVIQGKYWHHEELKMMFMPTSQGFKHDYLIHPFLFAEFRQPASDFPINTATLLNFAFSSSASSTFNLSS